MPVKPMLKSDFCFANIRTAHGFTGHSLAVIKI